jgi:hypothetical protein
MLQTAQHQKTPMAAEQARQANAMPGSVPGIGVVPPPIGEGGSRASGSGGSRQFNAIDSLRR